MPWRGGGVGRRREKASKPQGGEERGVGSGAVVRRVREEVMSEAKKSPRGPGAPLSFEAFSLLRSLVLPLMNMPAKTVIPPLEVWRLGIKLCIQFVSRV